MSDSAELISAFLHGLAAGAMAATTFALWRSSLSPHLKIAGALAGASLVAMFITETLPLWHAMGSPRLLLAIAYPVAGAFWLLVLSVFDDWRVTPWTLTPSAILLVSGFAMGALPPPVSEWIWVARNALSGLLVLHAGIVVVRGWSGDLLEARRRFRALLLGLGCLFALFEVAAGFAYRLDRDERWLTITAGHPYGGLILAMLCTALATLMLQPRLGVFGTSRRSEPALDARAETAERLSLDKLEGLMAAGAWRREGLTIGDLARELETPEHRLRRLINQRLGHRNFAEFVNSHRIAAAKRRLGNPEEARVTVAAIAFDLGYGSLGPFNRAFRAATGSSPTEWRRQALAAGSPEMKEAV